jgi:chaperonin GroEL
MNELRTRLENNNDSVKGVLDGIRKAAEIITSTMGGSGKNVLMFEKKNLQFTKDGVTVAKKIQFKDPEEDAGAQILITAANKTVRECGDGTTLTSLFTQELVSRLFTICETQPVNETLDKWREQINLVVKELELRSQKIESIDDIYNIALTSCKNETLARLLYEIYRKVGLKASISVQLSEHSPQSYYEVTKGLNFDGGLIHPLFANQLGGTFQAEKPVIWITDEVLGKMEDYIETINELHEEGIPLVIIAKDYSDSFIRYALTNKNSKNLQICLLKLPGWGEGVSQNIKDIKSFLTRFKIGEISEERVNKITVTPTDFTLYNNPEIKKVRTRIKQLEAQIESFTEEFDILDFHKRIDNLNQTSAIIYVGGRTLANAQEEFDRIEDAVGACRTACKGGYIKGAGAELVSIAENFTSDFQKVLRSPAEKILSNANIQLLPSFEPYNVKTRLTDYNLLDPTNIVITALLNAFAVTELLINTSHILHD